MMRTLAYGLVGLAAVLAPIALAALQPGWIGDTYGVERLRFELLGFTGSLALLAIGAAEARKLRGRPLMEWLPLLLALLVGMQALQLVGEYAEKLYDYQCYERAARALQRGRNPYGLAAFHYLYPPLLAQSLAWLYGVAAATAALFGLPAERTELWAIVFYLFQAVQVGLVLATYELCRRFGRSLGLAAPVVAALAAGLLLVDSPVLRTLRWSQINLLVLDCALVAVLLRGRAPWLAGLVLAVGIHLKLQPAVLLVPWLLTRQWRALAGCAAGVVAIALLQTGGGRDWTVWQQFVGFALDFPGGVLLRDNGLHGVIHNLFSLAGSVAVRGALAGAIEWAWRGAVVASGAWMLWRGWQRERAGLGAESRQAGHAVDALAWVLLAAPVVWEHHYVLAIPLLLWAAAGWGRRHAVALGAAALLCFAVPTFDVFPWSYHRLVGLAWILWLTRDPNPDADPAG